MTEDSQQLDRESPDVAALRATLAEVDSLAAPAVAPEVAPAQQQAGAVTVRDVQPLRALARPLLELAIPYLKGADDAAWAALDEPIAGLLNHYGVSLGDVMTNPWARLVGASIPLGLHAYHAWEQAKQQKPKEGGAPWLTAGVQAPEQAQQQNQESVLPAVVLGQ